MTGRNIFYSNNTFRKCQKVFSNTFWKRVRKVQIFFKYYLEKSTVFQYFLENVRKSFFFLTPFDFFLPVTYALLYDDDAGDADFVGTQYRVESHSLNLISLSIKLLGNFDTHSQQERISKTRTE